MGVQTTPKHTDLINLKLDAAEAKSMLVALDGFSREDNCLETHGYTFLQSSQVMLEVSLAVQVDGTLSVTLTREQVAILHCMVASAKVPWTEGYQIMEGNLYSLKTSGGYVPRYMLAAEQDVVRSFREVFGEDS